MVWVYIGAGVIGALVIFVVWAIVSENRKTKRQLREITVDDVDPLIRECIVTFREKLGLELDFNDLEGSTRILDENVGTAAVRKAFAKSGFGSYFVKPIGAFLGELIRFHRDAGWQEEEDGSLSVWIKDGDEEKTVDPFKMVLTQSYTKTGTVFTSLLTETLPPQTTAEPEETGAEAGDSPCETAAPAAEELAKEATDVETAVLAKQVERGANWFYWIAGLSLVNSVLFLTDSGWVFFFGLGITQVIDAVALGEGGDADYQARAVAFGLDVIAAAVFALFGFLANKERRWAFVVGMILYGLDAMLFFLVGDYLSFAFHCGASYGIYRGFRASGALRAKAYYEATVPGTSLRPAAVRLDVETDPEVRPERIVWPVVIMVITLAYGILFVIANAGDLLNYWKMAIYISLFGGILGMALKRKGGVTLLLISSVILLSRIVYKAALFILSKSEPPSFGAMVWALIAALVLAAWPLFLIVWFLQRHIRAFVKNEWT